MFFLPELRRSRCNRSKVAHATNLGLTILFIVGCGITAGAQIYAGVLGGVAAVSGDARSAVSPSASAFSSYDPKSGGALELLVGKHLSDYFTVQGNYVWNSNDLTVSAGSFSGSAQQAYQEIRGSSQQSLLANVLVYFRNRNSRLRPYLSVGTGIVHLSSSQEQLQEFVGSPALPPRNFSSNLIALNVPVGIDVKLGRGWAFRYTFSETISKNPIDDHLSPSGGHGFKNFLNLFGIVKQF